MTISIFSNFSLKILLGTILIMQPSCIKKEQNSAPLSPDIATSQAANLRRQIEDIDTIDLDSPVTPLAQAIRRKVILELSKDSERSPSVGLPPDGESFPKAVKETILEVLRAQTASIEGFQPSFHKPCSIDPNLITPEEIIYGLQRASLGSPRPEDFLDMNRSQAESLVARYSKTPWTILVGYPTKRSELNRLFETWFRELETSYPATIDSKIKQSLGLKRVEIPHWAQKIPPEITASPLVAGSKQYRCFVTSQVKTQAFKDVASTVAIDSLLEVDVFEGIRTLAIDIFVGEPVSAAIGRYLAHRPQVNSLALSNNGINEMQVSTSWLACHLTFFNLEKIPDHLRRQITKIRLNTGSVTKLRLYSPLFFFLTDQGIAQRFWAAVKRTFPSTVDFSFISSYDDTELFSAELVKNADLGGARRVHITIENPKSFLDLLKSPTHIQTLSLEKVPSSRMYLNMPQFFDKLKNTPHLRVRGFSLEGNQKALSRSLRSKAVSIRMTECDAIRSPMQTEFIFTKNQFPNLNKLRVINCPGLITSESPDKIEQIVRQTQPKELIEILAAENTP